MTDRVTQTKKTIVLADGNQYEVKPLTLKESKTIVPLLKELDKIGEELSEETINKVAELCFIILKKSITDLTIDRVLELVDLSSIKEIVLMASGRSI